MAATWAERAVFPTRAGPDRGSGWAASRKASRRSLRSLRSPVRPPEAAPDQSSEDEARATVHRGRSRTSILDQSGPRAGQKAGLAGPEPGAADAATRPRAGNRPPRLKLLVVMRGQSEETKPVGCRGGRRPSTIPAFAPADGCAAHCRMPS